MALTISQWHACLAVLLQNVDLDGLELEVAQENIIRDPQRAGREFTRFLQNGCRPLVGGLKVIPRPSNPATLPGLSEGWKLSADEHDARNDNLTEVDFDQIGFVTALREEESSITGEEKLRRLKASNQIRLGASVFQGLWLGYQASRENGVLETLYRLKKITYLDFFGDVLLPPDGSRCVLCLYRCDGGWRWYANRLDNGWSAGHVSAVCPAERGKQVVS